MELSAASPTQAERAKQRMHDRVCRNARAAKARIRAARIRLTKPTTTTKYEWFAERLGRDWRNMTDQELKNVWGND